MPLGVRGSGSGVQSFLKVLFVQMSSVGPESEKAEIRMLEIITDREA